MRHPQVVVYEADGRIAGTIRAAATSRHWSLHEPRRPESCLHLLSPDKPSVLILKLGSDLTGEMTLLERVTWIFPGTAVLVVSDRDDPATIGMAWDLGASYVLSPPQPWQRIPEIIAGLMESTLRPRRPANLEKREVECDGGSARP
jgi:DNA-binding NarL/FixJ family response regulator